MITYPSDIKVKLLADMIGPDVAIGRQGCPVENRTFWFMIRLCANTWIPEIDSPYIYSHTFNIWEDVIDNAAYKGIRIDKIRPGGEYKCRRGRNS